MTDPATIPPVQRADIHLASAGDIRVTIAEVQQGSDRWHRVLNALWDEGVIASIPDRAHRVLGALLRLRTEDGTSHAPIHALRTLTGLGERRVYRGLTDLVEHPRGLLAQRGRDMYLVLPGWRIAGRRETDPDPPPITRPVFRHRGVGDLTVGADAHKGSCARQTNQPKTEIQTQTKPEQSPGRDSSSRGVGGWPELSLFGQIAMHQGDARGVLVDLRVWAYMADALAACPALTVDRVLRTAAEVGIDASAVNKPVCLGKRLALALGVTLPAPPTQARGAVPAGLEGIARLRSQRHQSVNLNRTYPQGDPQ